MEPFKVSVTIDVGEGDVMDDVVDNASHANCIDNLSIIGH